MAGGLEMRQGMSMGRVFATTDVPARKADSQLVPLRADREAFLAAARTSRDALHALDMLAGIASGGHQQRRNSH